MSDQNRDVRYNDHLKLEWTDQYVTVKPGHAELSRFANVVGRVVTVNFNGKAVIDFLYTRQGHVEKAA